MKNFGGPTRGIGRILVLTLAVLGWQLICSPAHAQLAADEAVFTDISGTACGVVSAGSMSVVGTFDCDSFSEGVDVTSDGTLAVIGNCANSTLMLVDLTTADPTVLDIIDSEVRCVQELDIASDDSFGIATGSADGKVSKFTLDPFFITGTAEPWDPDGFAGGSPQDVHINTDGTVAVQPMFFGDFLLSVDVTGDVPEVIETIASPENPDGPGFLRHHGISLSEWDNDTILATADATWGAVPYVTVASLSSLSVITVLDVPDQGQPESVDITCDGTRAVVETSSGLMWLDMTTSPPSIIKTDDGEEVFGPGRIDNNSTSTVAFSADGNLLFVAGYLSWPDTAFGEEESQIDVYDATVDPPLKKGSIPFPVGTKIANVATLPCSAAPSEIEVAVDIKPGSCPNQLNVKSKGVLKVAILGTEDFDVLDIDPRTIQFEGVGPRHWKLRDVATPYDADTMQGGRLDCTKKGPDGFLDLIFKFKTRKIVKAIDSVSNGDFLDLTITGALFDGTPIVGDDVVRIKKKKKKKHSKKWIKEWLFSWLQEIKKEKKGHVISKAKSNWHRNYKRH